MLNAHSPRVSMDDREVRGRELNNGGLLEYSPFAVRSCAKSTSWTHGGGQGGTEEEFVARVEFPMERLPYVSQFLRELAIPLTVHAHKGLAVIRVPRRYANLHTELTGKAMSEPEGGKEKRAKKKEKKPSKKTKEKEKNEKGKKEEKEEADEDASQEEGDKKAKQKSEGAKKMKLKKKKGTKVEADKEAQEAMAGFLKQLRWAATWQYNYEGWYYHMAYLRITDESGRKYCPLILDNCRGTSRGNVSFIPLRPEHIETLRALAKWKIRNPSKQFEGEHLDMYNFMLRYFEAQWPPQKKGTKEGSEGYFVRLSSRSPKDVPKSMVPVQNAKDALFLFTRSERCYQDYLIYQQYLSPSKDFQMILLPWIEVPTNLEFRCFAQMKKLTAISQYAWFQAIDELQNKETLKEVKRAIVHFHQQLAPFIPYASYIFDVYLTREKPQGEDGTEHVYWRTHLIEFNPFYADQTSGSCLFDWRTDHSLLYGGEDSNEPLIRARVKRATAAALSDTELVFLDT